MTPESKRFIEYRNKKITEGYQQVTMLIPKDIKKDLYSIKNALVQDFKDNNMKIYNRKTKQIEDRIPKKSAYKKVMEEMEIIDNSELEPSPKVEAIEQVEQKQVAEPINPDPNHYSHHLNKENEKLKAEMIEKMIKEWNESIERVSKQIKDRNK